MKVGASQYHPGLTVRWVHHGCGFLSMRAHTTVGAVIAGGASSGYVVLGHFPGRSTVDEPFARRCDAKRAAEVLVGQWWREKCEREAKALVRLAGLYGVGRKAASPVQYTFRAACAEKIATAFRALADAAREAGESVRASVGVMSRLNRSPDTDIIVTVRGE